MNPAIEFTPLDNKAITQTHTTINEYDETESKKVKHISSPTHDDKSRKVLK